MVTSIQRIIVVCLITLDSAHSLAITPTKSTTPTTPSTLTTPLALSNSSQQKKKKNQKSNQKGKSLVGNWKESKVALRNRNCCVVSITGLEPQLRILQKYLADDGQTDLDLRARVRTPSSSHLLDDCLRVKRLCLIGDDGDGDDDDKVGAEVKTTDNENYNKNYNDDPCTNAIMELTQGIALLADGPLEGVCKDVFIRIVCASDYKARDPMYHTDKAPLRGYATLRGVGTDYMTRPCSLLEYVMLRTFGDGQITKFVQRAKELEFIVMKGDQYEASSPSSSLPSSLSSSSSDASHHVNANVDVGVIAQNPVASWLTRAWKRTIACVHRSPPGSTMGGRRVIVSLDLADGDDDREWYEINKKREWRSGMTQRKSRLVA